MAEAPENGKASHSVHANGMNGAKRDHSCEELFCIPY